MKKLLLLLTFLSLSTSWARGPGDDPIPFPFRQAPDDLVGHWNGSQIGDEIVVKHIHAKKGEKDRLFIVTYLHGQKAGQGYLYFSDNQMYCGYIHHEGPAYTLCIWRQDNTLKIQTLQKSGEWRESQWLRK